MTNQISKIEKKLEEKNLNLPNLGKPLGTYLNAVVANGLVFVSGKLPITESGELLYEGRLGDIISTEEGYEAAKLCLLHVLASIKEAVGDLDKIERVVRLVGYVATTSEYYDTPKVVNGASELMIDLLGESGKHARLAVNVPALPLNAPVELEGIFQIKG
ncbi:MAG: RidA family protein [Spirochaetes bacterium]|nr:RidA family protein [Spirochaetota bacterium]